MMKTKNLKLEISMLDKLTDGDIKNLLREFNIKIRTEISKEEGLKIFERDLKVLQEAKQFGIHTDPAKINKNIPADIWRIDAIHTLLDNVEREKLLEKLKRYGL